MRWRLLPETQLEILPAVEEAAEFVRSKADNFVILGIGGSALGPIAVHRALNHLYHNDLPSENENLRAFLWKTMLIPSAWLHCSI